VILLVQGIFKENLTGGAHNFIGAFKIAIQIGDAGSRSELGGVLGEVGREQL